MIFYFRDANGEPLRFKITTKLVQTVEPIIKQCLDQECYGHIEFTKNLPKAICYIKKEGNYWFNANTMDY